jgi:hypothetical protein
MGYPCIPSWEKTKPKDPFNYKLRTKEEVMKQHEYHQPNFPIIAEWKKYAAGDLREHEASDMMDRRSTVAKIRLDMRHLKLAHLQRERFAFLLGPRYDPRRPHTVKIVTKQYDTYNENFMRCNETLRELYWEALRAPDNDALFRRNPYRREKLIKLHLGKTKAERLKRSEKING